MKSYCRTDIGIKRNMNQDFVYASDQPVGPLFNLYIVADGMGGHAAGEFASRCAVETMVDYIENASETRPVRLLDEALQAANKAVYERSVSDKSCAGMGTTLVACTYTRECLYIVNVGDSRLYLTGDELEQITVDHSLVEEMVQAGQITSQEARVHPEKNVITRAVGMKDRIRTDLFDVSIHPGEIALLCSDGLTNMIPDKEIEKLIGQYQRGKQTLSGTGDLLIDTANKNGGSDNISVVLIDFTGSGD